eukprot:7157067-Prymnesium_polylepis.1
MATCSQQPCAERYQQACLSAPVAVWTHSFADVQCSFRCCVRFWMRKLGFDANERHWARAARHDRRRMVRADDDWD